MSKATRDQLRKDFPHEQLTAATRGLTLGRYAQAFNAGTNHTGDKDLTVRLDTYMNRGSKTEAHEHAFLDGNTNSDVDPEDYLRELLTRSDPES